ncbi:MAG TPA: DUF5060 domain-containing protein, partial [Clostridia bacterium]
MSTLHTWQRYDIVLTAAIACTNPYTDVIVWADLTGPGFSRRVYGFWDGGLVFRVRVTATAPGTWTWVSGCEVQGIEGADPGLSGQTGSFEAAAWSEAEKLDNPCRRGFLRASANGHAFQYEDGTPFLMLGDTWWATPTTRFPWREDDVPGDEIGDKGGQSSQGLFRPDQIGPDKLERSEVCHFQDMVRYRKAQGFNAIAMLAAHPAWANDSYPVTVVMNDADRTVIRNAWQQAGTDSAKNMANEGGRPFFFPGRVPGYEDLVPDFDRINPEYFQAMDRKIYYLNDMGF